MIEHSNDSGADDVGASDERSWVAVEADRLDGLVEAVAVIEERVARLQAEQVVLVAEFVRGSRAVVSAHGLGSGWSDESQRLAAMQVATARRVSVGAAEHYLVDAVRLVTDLPRVLEVLADGLTTLPAVRAVCSETANLQPESLPIADEMLADDLLSCAPSQARRAARNRVSRQGPGTPPAIPAR
jgi:hypothetical protein